MGVAASTPTSAPANAEARAEERLHATTIGDLHAEVVAANELCVRAVAADGAQGDGARTNSGGRGGRGARTPSGPPALRRARTFPDAPEAVMHFELEWLPGRPRSPWGPPEADADDDLLDDLASLPPAAPVRSYLGNLRVRLTEVRARRQPWPATRARSADAFPCHDRGCAWHVDWPTRRRHWRKADWPRAVLPAVHADGGAVIHVPAGAAAGSGVALRTAARRVRRGSRCECELASGRRADPAVARTTQGARHAAGTGIGGTTAKQSRCRRQQTSA